MKEIKIGVAFHKAANYYPSSPYIPIQVGAIYHESLGIQKDCEGDNISADNAYCSELSATYWLWKNTKSDYKGLFHYRRFLTFKKSSLFFNLGHHLMYYASKVASPFIRDMRYFMPTFSIYKIHESESESYLSKFYQDLRRDIDRKSTDCYVMGEMKNSTRTIDMHLRRCIGGKHFEWLIPLIQREYPEYFQYLKKTLSGGRLMGYNMIIAKNELFNEYCNILFGILRKYHNYMNNGVPCGIINNSMLRDSGYVGEVLTDAYIRMVIARGAKVKRLNCVLVDIEPTGMSYRRVPMYKRLINMIFKGNVE